MSYSKGERYKKDVVGILDGRVKIYRTTSRIYQAQIWINEEGKYVRKSLRTDDLETAKQRAENLFIECRALAQSGQKIFSISAKELVEKFLSHMENEVEKGNVSEGRRRNIKTFTKHYLNFIGRDAQVKNIDRKKFRDYFAFRRGKKKDILASVVQNEASTIKQMYRWATDEGYISSVEATIDFGKIKVRKDEGVREAYSIEDYQRLVGVSKNWWKQKGIGEEEKYYRRLLNDFIILMSNGGFRTGELRLLKWKDIKQIYETKDGETFAQLTIRAENTKVRKSRTFEMRRGDVFKRIQSYSNFTERNDFVFSHFLENKEMTKEILYGYYKQLLRVVKEKQKTFDDTKTLYCLRHFWISIRILAGHNVYDIAKISGTSLKQIEHHYDAIQALVTSQKMNKTKMRFTSKGQMIVGKEVVLE
jgi:integrase